MYKSSLSSEWGTLFGLGPSDLTDEQLSKISFTKLIEFIGFDPRVDSIICDKMFTVPIKDLARIGEISKELEGRTELVSKYNDCLRIRKLELEKARDYYYSRERIVLWNLLDDVNKEYEFKLWMGGVASIINDRNVDFNWLYSRDKVFADSIVKNILAKTSYSISDAAKNMISNLPKDDFIRWLPEIFAKDKHFYIYCLSNPNTPDEYILKSLRAIAKLTHPPEINVKISNVVLNELPPVTRLEVLEKVMSKCHSNNIPLVDIKNPDDLKQLVFSSTTRHYDRVSTLVNNYKRIVNWRDQ